MQQIDLQMKNYLKYLAVFPLFLFCLLASTYVQAHNKVVVIPLTGSSFKSVINVINVAKSNGDFTNPVAALASISDANANNPYLVVIASGTYTLDSPLIMKEFVSVVGSGENLTTLKGSFSSVNINDASSSLVQLANNSVLSGMTIVNAGHDTYSIGIYSNGSNKTTRLENIKITVISRKNLGVATGIRIGGSPIISQTKINVFGTWVGFGISASGSPFINDATISVFGGVNGTGISVNNTPSLASIVRSSIVISGGDGGALMGVDCSGCLLNISECTINPSSADVAYGIYQTAVSSATISHSVITSVASRLAISLSSRDAGAKTYVSQSTLIGALSGDGIKNCVASDDGSGSTLNDDCTDPTPVL